MPISSRLIGACDSPKHPIRPATDEFALFAVWLRQHLPVVFHPFVHLLNKSRPLMMALEYIAPPYLVDTSLITRTHQALKTAPSSRNDYNPGNKIRPPGFAYETTSVIQGVTVVFATLCNSQRLSGLSVDGIHDYGQLRLGRMTRTSCICANIETDVLIVSSEAVK
ncbi:uncharacterized protein CLUP02_02709 [Colletotrichum lupini]|uniref:Uncharacterized protein n=1 Tax=Colletotrichum lupini TaxID=145971 RepID=A0A9Q8WC14_9PEZI|nr:uncharacterized protein CLUP02_02709 [Colletotrichum lupini]UQC77242.1 hypothetical protein CLUP02_02709 [Colletotrichum lupini]